MSTEADAGDRQVYALPVDGGTRTRLTTAPGAHAIEPSPDGATWALLSSSATRPPEVFLAPAPKVTGTRRPRRSIQPPSSR